MSEPRGQDVLAITLRASWSARTSNAPDWSPQNPAEGQCAVTTLVLQDYLGGTIMRCETSGQSHYFLRLPGGTDTDLTREQFGTITTATEAAPRDRSAVLSHCGTRQRYEILAGAVALRMAAAAQEAMDLADGWDDLSCGRPEPDATKLRLRAFELREAICGALLGEGEGE